MSGKGLGAEGEENVMEDSQRQAAARRKRGEKGEESPDSSDGDSDTLSSPPQQRETSRLTLSTRVFRKTTFLSYVLPSGYMVRLGDWSTQKKFQRYRPINDLGMAI